MIKIKALKQNNKLMVALGVFVVTTLLGLVYLTGASIGQESDKAWTERCNEETGQCEIFQLLAQKDTGQRFLEFVIGYPQGVENWPENTAQGVMSLPLGILLDRPVAIRVDEQERPFTFTLRYCTLQGCVGFLTMNEEVLDVMRAGNAMTISFVSGAGRNVDVEMSLKGFTKALDDLS